MKFSFFRTKNINMSETLFCLGGIIFFLIKNNDEKLSVDDCYNLYLKEYVDKKIVKYKLNFSQFLLAMDYLYIIKLIIFKKDKLVINNENFKTIFK
ncbi:ABC-three component system middle component 6 [Spiroplasma endosymbiont of Danaus chrysippus]|uniref:ABC-three component system middle component 6 n=1 Tax=Spiroplasma endosymbiont of Danaus chrysippus TaxID=2691041 RepID=UPI00157B0C22|nr:ABC-three component system middle component 6 [Spiroplasma endosymbiont of Danaus chrysippus]